MQNVNNFHLFTTCDRFVDVKECVCLLAGVGWRWWGNGAWRRGDQERRTEKIMRADGEAPAKRRVMKWRLSLCQIYWQNGFWSFCHHFFSLFLDWTVFFFILFLYHHPHIFFTGVKTSHRILTGFTQTSRAAAEAKRRTHQWDRNRGRLKTREDLRKEEK